MAGLLDGLVGDSTAKDELGLTEADRRQPLWSSLIKAGLLGVAAGDNIMPAQRAPSLRVAKRLVTAVVPDRPVTGSSKNASVSSRRTELATDAARSSHGVE